MLRISNFLCKMNSFSLRKEESLGKRIVSLQCLCIELARDGSDLVWSLCLETVTTKTLHPEWQRVAESMLMQKRT